jgi:beta-1,4-N-acetylglucosaminyltransferase
VVIFVTVGHTDFDALVQEMDRLASGLGEEVLMQIGSGRYEPRHARYFRYAPALEPYMAQADLVVCHAGLGVIVEALGLGKRVVCVPNPATYHGHQASLAEIFSRDGHLIWCRRVQDLSGALEQARTFTPVPYHPPPCRIHEIIHAYLLMAES